MRIDKRFVRKILFLCFVLLIWQYISFLEFWPEYVFPSPVSVFSSLIKGFTQGMFATGIIASLKRLLLGYFISLVIGIPLGLILGRSNFVQDTIGTIILGLQALPSVCWMPLALLWFGLSEMSILFVVIMGAVLSITLSTSDGVKNANPLFIKAGQTLGARGMDLYGRIILPSALPSIISGMKLGWTFAWRSLMAGELLFVIAGLGQLLNMGRELNDMPRVMAVMLVIIIIGLLVDKLIFKKLENIIRERWGLNVAE
jgi:NitT/TauT family transport system permease protein